jgi:protein TonB
MASIYLCLRFSLYILEELKKEPLEGYCGDPEGPQEEMRPCSIFNSASSRAALKLKYKPKIVDGKATSVEGVLHRFTFIMAKDD